MRARRSRNAVLACALTGVAAIASASLVEPAIHVVYNASGSVPRGWYRIVPVHEFAVENIVLADLPNHVAELAGERGYLPAGVPILKRIGAASPQQVCIRRGEVRVDGVTVAVARTFDGVGRPLFAWSQCRRLDEGELFLLSATHHASFDSRYFGPIRADAVLGSARPLWTWRDR
jgi:conjugative transfer signal peptidase TraF